MGSKSVTVIKQPPRTVTVSKIGQRGPKGADGAGGSGGGSGFSYLFGRNVDGNPAAGHLSFDTLIPSSTSYVSFNNLDVNGDVSAALALIPIGSLIQVSGADPSKFIILQTTEIVGNDSAYSRVHVTHISHTYLATFLDEAPVSASFIFAGTNGLNGADGKTILSGNGAPGSIGTPGDFYLDKAAHDFYGPKGSGLGGWGAPTSLIGPAGAAGGGGGGSAFDPSTTFTLFDDFSTSFYQGSGQILGERDWTTVQTGSPNFTFRGTNASSDSSHIGVLEISAAANGDGGGFSSGQYGNPATVSFRGGGGVLSISVLAKIQISNGVDNSEIDIGFSDSPGWAAAGNKMSLVYLKEVSPNWQLVTINSGGSQMLDTGIPVVGGWQHLKVQISADGSTVSGYVNGVLGASTGSFVSTQLLPPMISLRKTLGASPMYLGVDYIKIDKAFTVAR